MYSFLKYARYRQTQTSSGNVENTQLQFGSLDRHGATHFLSLRNLCLGFDPYYVNPWARSTNQPLC